MSYDLNSIPINGINNTAVGFQSLLSITGNGNTAIGYRSLTSSVKNSWNTAIGHNSLSLHTSGNYNVAIGGNSLGLSVGGFGNTAVGYSSLESGGYGGFYNTAFGYSSLAASSAVANSAYGTFSLGQNTTGNFNTASGYLALKTNITGSNNTAIGYDADVASNALTNATAIGNGAIVNASNTMQLGNPAVTHIYAGTGNTTFVTSGLQVTGGVPGVGKVLTSDAFGTATWQTPSGGGGGTGWALTGNAGTIDGTNFIGTTDNVPLSFRVSNQVIGRLDPITRNFYVGSSAGAANISGQNNNAMGDFALGQNTTGSSNVAIGGGALAITTTGGNNSALGTNASTTLGNLFESTAIGVGALVNTSSKMRLGSTSLTVVEGPMYMTTSDGRFKNNISEEDVKGLEFINKLRPVIYNFNSEKFTEFLTQNMPKSLSSKYLNNDFAPSTAIRQSGFIAQEVEVAANAVGYDFNGLHKPENKNDYYSLAYAQFVMPLVKAVQELSTQNENLKHAMDEQAKINESLKKDMEALRTMVTGLKINSVEGSIKITEATTEAKLYQNAPNPFSKTTTIRYSIPANAKRATISITSTNGIKIKTFELKSKSGQSLDISGGQLSAGTYIYSLIIDEVLIDSKTMILTR